MWSGHAAATRWNVPPGSDVAHHRRNRRYQKVRGQVFLRSHNDTEVLIRFDLE